ncbi:MAG: YbjN domain-containing protein, partial [Actinomycetia bacterium]|nr:YbjN domain-containing protein [Actinomycetes bacterium]
WSIDDTGDVYSTGRAPLAAVSEAELDRLQGAVLEYADGSFNTMLELGFGAAIRREWAWRVARGESVAHLVAFERMAAGAAPPAVGLGGSGEQD